MAEQTLFSLIVEFLLVGSIWALLAEVAVVFVVYTFVVPDSAGFGMSPASRRLATSWDYSFTSSRSGNGLPWRLVENLV